MNRAEKYIKIEEAGRSKTGLTSRFEVRMIGSNASAGEITWYGGWRKYVFHPEDGSFYDKDALQLIAEFCARATNEQLGGKARPAIISRPR